jgi:hypothetical protein
MTIIPRGIPDGAQWGEGRLEPLQLSFLIEPPLNQPFEFLDGFPGIGSLS